MFLRKRSLFGRLRRPATAVAEARTSRSAQDNTQTKVKHMWTCSLAGWIPRGKFKTSAGPNIRRVVEFLCNWYMCCDKEWRGHNDRNGFGQEESLDKEKRLLNKQRKVISWSQRKQESSTTCWKNRLRSSWRWSYRLITFRNPHLSLSRLASDSVFLSSDFAKQSTG